MKLIDKIVEKIFPGPAKYPSDWMPELGTAVRLKSGGPAMLVCSLHGIHDKSIMCIWVKDSGYGFQSAFFDSVTLRLIG